MKLTHYGLREWLGSGVIAACLIAGSVYLALSVNATVGWILTGLFAVVWVAIAAFFRDPWRSIPKDPTTIVSPADGVVRDIEFISADDENSVFEGRNAVRIGIFLSVLDVHLNRAPCDLEVEYGVYKKGCYHDARNPLASKENESMLIGGTADVKGKRFPMAIKQISGAIARRIVCPVQKGDKLNRGDRYGMIKFGSRTELYLPAGQDISIEVEVGTRVYGGATVMAKLVNGDENQEERGTE